VRVDVDGEDRKNDTETSVFVGNMPWITNDEDLMQHFKKAGKVVNIRVIRDPTTFVGKGFGYI